MADRACLEYRELISAFVDGEATREENARLRQHLASCPECRATLDAYRKIGGSIRALPSLHAPYHLTESIFAQTVDAEPRRLFLITSRLGYSLAAVASVLLIFVVAAYLIIGGYERGIEPTVASSAPEQAATPEETVIWPQYQPVKIEFNKEMNRESVIAALGMQPPLEKDRLSHTWDGNTLVIGGNPIFKPNTEYEIKISTDATDKWGNPLKEPFELRFTTSTTQTTIQTPTPSINPTATVEPAIPTETASATESPATYTPEPGDGDVTPAAPTATVGNGSAPGSGNGTPIAPVDPIDPDEPTMTPTTPRPTSTPTPTISPVEPTGTTVPTSTPTPSPTATMTPAPPPPTATATATATSPALPTATSTPDTIPVVGAIGDVYWRDQTVRDRLGEPLGAEYPFVTDQLDFQRGVMMLDESRTNIYVLKFGSGWDMFGIPPIPPEDYPTWEPGPEAGIYEPGNEFGALWESNATLREDVGYALSMYPTSYTGMLQLFEHGRMISTPTTVYVIYDDGTWDWFAYTASS